MRTILFPIIITLILGLIELYSFKALRSRWDNYSKTYRRMLRGIYFGLMLLSLIGLITLFIVGRGKPSWYINFLFAFIVLNLIVKFVFILFVALDDFRRLIIWTYRKVSRQKENRNEVTNGISRSDFFLKSGLIAAAVPAISLPLGMVIGPYKYTLHFPTVKLPNLPASFNGLKIVQLSDIHAGSFYNKEAVNKGIDLLLRQKPDIIFFTGDLVNNKATEMADYMDVFARVQAPMGVYSILGNHDYGDYEQWDSDEAKAANLDHLKRIHGELGWRLLLDEHVYLERGDDKIALIGVQNWGAGFHQIGDLKKAYSGVEAPVQLLLSHDPTHFDEEVKTLYPAIDITFSGHTHGAQMGIETGGFKWSPISLRYSKWAGLYQEGNQYLYVNRGYGFLGYPGRIGIWPEITVMTLTSDLT
jgi:uncharacterized protein